MSREGGGFRLYRSGEEEPLAEAVALGDLKKLRLVAANPLDLEASYELTHPTHSRAPVSFSRIFDSPTFCPAVHLHELRPGRCLHTHSHHFPGLGTHCPGDKCEAL